MLTLLTLVDPDEFYFQTVFNSLIGPHTSKDYNVVMYFILL